MSIGRHVSSAAVLTAFAAAGCVSQGEFDKLQSAKNQEIASLQSSRSALEQPVRNLESQRAGLESQRSSLERQRDSLAKEKDTLTQQVAALEQQRAQLQASEKQIEARYDTLLANLNEEGKKAQLHLRQLKDMLTVDVAKQLFFDSGRATLKDTGKQ